MSKIFISYKRQDKDKVFPVVEEIKKKTGVDCWIDLEGIESGDQFQNVIIDAIDNAEIVVFMLSKNFIAPFKDERTGMVDLKRQTFPEKEVMYALRHGKRLVPLSIDGTSVSDCKWLDFSCSGLNYVLWKNYDQRNKFYSDVCQWTGGDDNAPIPAPAPAPAPARNGWFNFKLFNDSFNPVINVGIVAQSLALIYVLLIVAWTMFNGCLSIGNHLHWSQLLLVLALAASIFSTYKLKTCDIRWLIAIFVLDFIVLLLACKLCFYVFDEWYDELAAVRRPTSRIYTWMYRFGRVFSTMGRAKTGFCSILLTMAHFSVVRLILCLKKNGRSGWSLFREK